MKQIPRLHAIKRASLLSSFAPPDGVTAAQYLRKLVYDGSTERYGEITDTVRERVERELEMIEQRSFADGFLIV